MKNQLLISTLTSFLLGLTVGVLVQKENTKKEDDETIEMLTISTDLLGVVNKHARNDSISSNEFLREWNERARFLNMVIHYNEEKKV